MGDASILMKLLGFLWMNIGIALIAITLQQPAQTQLQMNKTAELLLGYDFCQNSVDDQTWRTARIMVDRTLHNSSKIYFLQAFAIDQHFPHKVLFIAPNDRALDGLNQKIWD
ncbi:hypothetical protein COOONC_25035 [Cooperia oncophora]